MSNEKEKVEKLESIDRALNIIGSIFFLLYFTFLLIKKKCHIDTSAIIICALYPVGSIA